jgi:hypothetical protein
MEQVILTEIIKYGGGIGILLALSPIIINCVII